MHNGYNPTAESEQNMQNLSFDRELKVNAVESLTVNPITNQLERPFAIQGNASQVITPVTVGDVTTFTKVKTIGANTYTQTTAINNVTGVITISPWS